MSRAQAAFVTKKLLLIALSGSICGLAIWFNHYSNHAVYFPQTVEAAQSAFRYAIEAIAVLAAGFAVLLSVQCAFTPGSRNAGAEAASKISNSIKRYIDILLSIILLLALSPVLVLVSALILALEGRPVFYVSRRFISLHNCVSIWKLRTMVRDAKSPVYRLHERFMRDGYLDIPLSCEVYTPLGRILERTQLVETLQLFNIIFQGMSFVGNRPLPLENIDLLKQFKGWEERFDSPSGLTGISQVVGKFSQTPLQRLELECLYSRAYKRKRGNILWCDFVIVLCTVRALLTGKFLSFEMARSLLLRACGESGK